MTSTQSRGELPSSKWLSFDGWDYGGMKERLEKALKTINKTALVAHAEHIIGHKLTMSEPFSAGQYWICFELVAENSTLVIARVRLPRHPDASQTFTDEDMAFATECEVATMRYVREKLASIITPCVYTYEPAESVRANEAGAAYMLIEGFRGNTLLDVEYDMTQLPTSVQKRIMTQWTRVQVELATLTLPLIGSISSLSPTGEPIMGSVASASAEGFKANGPFNSSADYFAAAGQAAVDRFKGAGTAVNRDSFATVGARVFCDIVANSELFDDIGIKGSFPVNHMDLGTQNIIVDDDFNFLAIIDWEFAQSAPWQVNHYPMPFPLLDSQEQTRQILADSNHLAHKNVLRQETAREMYRDAFRAAEEDLAKQGRPLAQSMAEVLDSTASRIYVCFTNLGRMPEQDEELVRRMARLAFDWDDAKIDSYVASMEAAR